MSPQPGKTRKPRIALMGEFSAGKSTLSNLLLGARPLPEKVTATRLSPVWLAHGQQPPYKIDVNGHEELISLDNLEAIPVEETRVIRLFFETDILEVCDLIDFPGISDPNMSSDVWQRMLDEVDAVLWCTHATQAWRQSEAAVWDTMPEAVKSRSTLLITRFDKLTTDRDKRRVLARVKRETEGQFGATFPISLTDALSAGEDYEAFEKSGAGVFLEHLITVVTELSRTVAHLDRSIYVDAKTETPVEAEDAVSEPEQQLNRADLLRAQAEPAPRADTAATQDAPTATPQEPTPAPAPDPDVSAEVINVAPRRVAASGERNHARAARPSDGARVIDMTHHARSEKEAQPAAKRANSISELTAIFKAGDSGAEDSAPS